jgi:putative RNA 2'-phosphotransferase
MSQKNKESTSKLIALVLRHKPEEIGITLDEHGWANVNELIAGIAKTQPFDMSMLEEIVSTDEKQRYSFNEDKTLIRANQGHSIPVDVELEQKTPPEVLYHGTGEKYTASIDVQGLIPKSRLYVHLSPDYDTAVKVGSRHGKPVVYTVAAGEMQKNGYVFYQSVNGVWLTKNVPVEFLRKEDRR